MTPREQRIAVIKDIAAAHGMKAGALLARDRKRNVAHARFAAMAAVRAQFGDSTTKIARLFGGLDHTSVVHGLRRHAELSAN
jgi:chromosomal replication initiation ATPase DnaA